MARQNALDLPMPDIQPDALLADAPPQARPVYPSTSSLTVSGITVQISRKAIKNLHLSVNPPDGEVRISAPPHLSDDNVRLAIVTRLGWIKQQRKNFQAQARQTPREMLTGETHYYLGQRYRLEVKTIPRNQKQRVAIASGQKMLLLVHANASTQKREVILSEWYRTQLKAQVAKLLATWTPIIGQSPASWGIRKMKTKWGSCNPDSRRIWLNLELAKKPIVCQEYILVHELIHLIERRHNERFRELMAHYLPQWRSLRDRLNQLPLAHEAWEYESR